LKAKYNRIRPFCLHKFNNQQMTTRNSQKINRSILNIIGKIYLVQKSIKYRSKTKI